MKLAEYEESIRQSIRIILETARGERVMRPDFGCGIHERVFALNDSATRGIIEDEVREALLNWEPRIEVLDVEARAEGSEGQVLMINIEYKVRSTENRFNLVYPFYLNRSHGLTYRPAPKIDERSAARDLLAGQQPAGGAHELVPTRRAGRGTHGADPDFCALWGDCY